MACDMVELRSGNYVMRAGERIAGAGERIAGADECTAIYVGRQHSYSALFSGYICVVRNMPAKESLRMGIGIVRPGPLESLHGAASPFQQELSRLFARSEV